MAYNMGAGASTNSTGIPKSVEEAREMGYTQEQIERSELWKKLQLEKRKEEFMKKYPSMGGENVFGDNKHLLPESAEELYAQGILREEDCVE